MQVSRSSSVFSRPAGLPLAAMLMPTATSARTGQPGDVIADTADSFAPFQQK